MTVYATCGTECLIPCDGRCRVPTIRPTVVSQGGGGGSSGHSSGQVRDTVPNETGSEQPKGQRDTRDTGPDGGPDAGLLAAIRTGTWLDGQTFPEISFPVPGLIAEGFTLLVGPPKVGKSWLIGDVLLAIASGGHALGQLKVAKHRVLYLALEDGHRRMQSRCRKLMGDKVALPALFHYVTQVPPGEILRTVDVFLEQHPDTALVVIDTLGKVMPQAMPGESAYQRDYRVGVKLWDIAARHPGLALVVIHHDRKAGADDFVERVSGTNGLAGAADTILVLARRRHEADGLLEITGREIPEGEYAIKMVDGWRWMLDGRTLDESAANARKRKETAGLGERSAEIIDYVAQHPEGVRAGAVKAKFGDDAGRYLSRQVDAGRLKRAARGLYLVPPVSRVSPLSQTDTDQGERSGQVRDTVPNACPECSFPVDHEKHRLLCEGAPALIRPGFCQACLDRLDPAMVEAGDTIHPGCAP